jgi:hypothetical protein
MANIPPPQSGMKPMDYYLFLYRSGVSPYEAYQATSSAYGPPKSKEQLAQEAQSNAAMSNLAAVGGQTAGVIGGAYLGSQAAGLFSTAPAVAGGTAVGGTAVAGGTAAGGTAVAGGTAAGGTVAGGTAGAGGATTLGAIGSYALPVAAVVGTLSTAWETGMKDILRGRGDRADWINQGANLATAFVPNALLKLMGKRSIGKMMTSGKSDAQLIRDDFRGTLRETGVADDNYEVTLADGSKFNIGLDGKTRYKNVDSKTTRQAWDIDFSNPLAVFATEQLDPMIQRIYEGVDRSKIPTEQFTGMLVNAVASNAKSNEDVLANIRTVLGQSSFAREAGFDPTPVPGPTQPIVRPEAGKVLRVSPGMYMNDQGKVSPALTMREALELNYGKEK